MDPFRKLPPEICLDIFLRLHSKYVVNAFAKASSYILSQYLAFKIDVLKSLLEPDFDDEMIQDAMAIILFPSTRDNGNLSSTFNHLKVWTAKQLPNPLKKGDRRLCDEFDKLHSRVLLFIEDYLTKGTAVFPLREYLCLPDLSLTSSRNQLTFKGQNIITRFNAADLTDTERRGLLKAFLRFELICKICCPQRQNDIILWDLSHLYRYKGRPLGIQEREALRCVQIYLESLYGAMFAQCSNAKLPDIPVDFWAPHTTASLLAEHLYVDPDSHIRALGLESHDHKVAASLACFGFDLATSLIRCATGGRHGRECLKEWFGGLYQSGNPRFPNYTPNFLDQLLENDSDYEDEDFEDFFEDGDNYFEDDFDYTENTSSVWDESDQNTSEMYQLLGPRFLGHSTLQRDIYRQRAWVFLENARFYLPLDREHSGARQRLDGTLDMHIESSFAEKKGEESRDAEPEAEYRGSLPSEMKEGCFGKLAPFWH